MINKAGENLTGWASSEAIGQPLKAVFNMQSRLNARQRRRKSGYRNEAQSILLTTGERTLFSVAEGTEHMIEQVASPIRDGKNEFAA